MRAVQVVLPRKETVLTAIKLTSRFLMPAVAVQTLKNKSCSGVLGDFGEL